MEKLIRNSSRLIAQHNCVIIPGLGAFLAHNVPASYNAKEQIFMPPHRTLGFNAQVAVDDALLLSEYLADGNMTFEEAETALRNDTTALRERLAKNGVVRFGELGTFSMDINGTVSFKPGENGIDDPYNFGFEPIAIPLLKECDKEIVIKRKDFRKYIAVAAAIILAFIFVTPISDSAYEPGMQASVASIVSARNAKAPSAPKENVAEETCNIAPVADTATENIITEVVEEGNAAEEEKYNAPCAPTTDNPGINNAGNEKIFSIIVASSPNADNAKLAIKELNEKHEAAYSVIEGDGRHRIALKSFNCNSDATNALKEIKNIFPDAWVLTHKQI